MDGRRRSRSRSRRGRGGRTPSRGGQSDCFPPHTAHSRRWPDLLRERGVGDAAPPMSSHGDRSVARAHPPSCQRSHSKQRPFPRRAYNDDVPDRSCPASRAIPSAEDFSTIIGALNTRAEADVRRFHGVKKALWCRLLEVLVGSDTSTLVYWCRLPFCVEHAPTMEGVLEHMRSSHRNVFSAAVQQIANTHPDVVACQAAVDEAYQAYVTALQNLESAVEQALPAAEVEYIRQVSASSPPAQSQTLEQRMMTATAQRASPGSYGDHCLSGSGEDEKHINQSSTGAPPETENFVAKQTQRVALTRTPINHTTEGDTCHHAHGLHSSPAPAVSSRQTPRPESGETAVCELAPPPPPVSTSAAHETEGSSTTSEPATRCTTPTASHLHRLHE